MVLGVRKYLKTFRYKLIKKTTNYNYISLVILTYNHTGGKSLEDFKMGGISSYLFNKKINTKIDPY